MLRALIGSLVWMGWLATLQAQPGLDRPIQKDKVIHEAWDAAYLEGARAGYYHSVIRESQRDGKPVRATTLTMNLQVRRYNSVVPLRMAISTTETPAGKVLGLSLTHFLDRGKVVQTGDVENGQLMVRTNGAPVARALPWNDDVIGLARQERIYKEKKVKPGDQLAYLSYELSLQTAVKLKATVKEFEEVDLLKAQQGKDGTSVDRVKTRLLRVEVRSDPVQVGENRIQLPMQVLWLDENLLPARSETLLPGLGRVTLYRTTKAVAEKEGIAPELLPDLGLNTLIHLSKGVERPHDASRIVYRIQYQGEDDPATLFTQDARQSFKKLEGSSFELDIHALRKPAPNGNGLKQEKEYLGSSHFLDSADERIQMLAKEAVGDETDPWRKAQRIEKLVHSRMKVASDVGFSTASQIAADLRGDCRQHAMLTAAMCRAAGIPARTALGLVYGHDPRRGPMLVFHMWTEVLINGQWLGIDATLGKGSIGPGHLKISDHSWQDIQTLAPLLAPIRVIGKIKVDVVRVE